MASSSQAARESDRPMDDDDDDGSGSEESSESESGAEEEASSQARVPSEEPAVVQLVAGARAKHDHLGDVFIVRLRGDEGWQENKTLVKLPAKPGRKECERWVCTDLLGPAEEVDLLTPMPPLGKSRACMAREETEDFLRSRASEAGCSSVPDVPWSRQKHLWSVNGKERS